jgi:hypothetical protein
MALVFLIVFLVTLVGFLIFLLWGIYFWRFSKKELHKSLNFRTYLIKIQKEIDPQGEEARKSPQEVISVAEQFFASLSFLKRTHKSLLDPRDHIVFEIAATEKNISFYMVVPDNLAQVTEKQLHAVYPKASIEAVDEYTVFEPNSQIATGNLKLRQKHFFPIRTYYALQSDPLNGITNTLSKLQKDQSVVIQYVFRPAEHKYTKRGPHIAREMAQGKNFQEASRSKFGKVGKGVLKQGGKVFGNVLQPKGQQQMAPGYEDDKPVVLSPTEQRQMEALQGKVSKMNFEVNVRVACSSPTQEQAEILFHNVASSFDQFDDPDLNAFIPKVSKPKKELVSLVYHYFDPRERLILNTEEVTSIFHLPNQFIETPNIRWLGAKQAPAPDNLPAEGVLLGKNVYRGIERDVHLTPEDRRRHLYVIGKTGTGKTTFLENVIVQDVRNGDGLCVVDPHGDLIENILTYIPKERAEDVILFEPGETARPMGLNLLEYDERYPEQKTFVINEMINIFDRLYDLRSTGGPIFEQYARNAMLLIMDDPESGSTLMEISRVLADDAFRKYKLERCKDPTVVHFWTKQAEKAGGEAALANMVPYITSKLTSFVSNSTMRPIIGQQKSSFNLRDVMDQKKILLVNLSKGKIGELNSHLLGMVLVGKILVAALSRADTKEHERPDFHLYLDEFQNATTDSIAIILSEARKYHLTLNIAHQFIAQLQENIRDAVFGNVGSMMAFRIGPDDAEFLVRQYAPTFSETDLINIDKYNAYAKLIIDGTPSKAFSLQILPPTSTFHPDWKNEKIGAAIRELSSLKYGRPRDIVEREILERTKLG